VVLYLVVIYNINYIYIYAYHVTSAILLKHTHIHKLYIYIQYFKYKCVFLLIIVILYIVRYTSTQIFQVLDFRMYANQIYTDNELKYSKFSDSYNNLKLYPLKKITKCQFYRRKYRIYVIFQPLSYFYEY